MTERIECWKCDGDTPECPVCGGAGGWVTDHPDAYRGLGAPPPQLSAIADVVLAYRPKPKSKPAKKRKRRAAKAQKQK